ncbi:MAG: UDP-N-acetylmuramoyl-L-alanyl-D-glutamate--2,6-diaminopimelate ligase [Patescibacteria group bacterium]
MFNENKILNKLLGIGRKIIPRKVFKLAQPIYHWCLSMLGAVIYRFPSRSMRVIAVTGTKGKSTVVFMVSKIFEEQGEPVAAIGSLGFKIKDRTWPNILKMTLPGRLKLQKFLYRAKNAGCKYVVLEATSEGIVQNRLAGINVDCAVFTNLHREHLESHGSFENYMAAKQKLFLKTKNRHVLNMDDPNFEKFANYQARTKITFGAEWGMVSLKNLRTERADLNLKLLGDFNEYNALAALSVAYAYDLDMDKAVSSLNSIVSIPGRMEVIRSSKGFDVIVDYAHTPDSLEAVYKNLKPRAKKLVCVLGAAGGGRDKWKRPEFGKIAARYCDEIILTNEDPFDEDPGEILNQIGRGFDLSSSQDDKLKKIIDRREAIKRALTGAESGDIVVITGKGSETSIAVSGGKKIPWSDRAVVDELLK